jgi:hypothetical protein
MALPLPLLRILQHGSAEDAWAALLDELWERFSKPLAEDTAVNEVTKRDSEVVSLDLFLATAGWDLWRSFGEVVPRSSAVLTSWWDAQPAARAVLVLDALSLRELPWLLQGATERAYTIHQARPTAAELPADTTPFARALGVPQRSSLENDTAPGTLRLLHAHTETTGHPWTDVCARIGAQPNWLVWHHWPDSRVHALAEAGHGLNVLTREVAAQLTSDDFWQLVGRLATGRRLVITSDHGYAASGLFPDVTEERQKKYLKDTYKSGRSGQAHPPASGFLPPLDLHLSTPHGVHGFVLGRRKWASQGGYPLLAHGGLSLLEVVVPFIELSKPL